VTARILGALILLIAGAIAVSSAERIAIIAVHQQGTLEPATITVFVRIPPAKENRAYLVEAVSEDGAAASSGRELHGESSAGPFPPTVLRLTGGTYAVGATLLGEHGRVLARSRPHLVRVQCRSCPEREPEE